MHHLYADGVMVSHLFLAVDIGVTASSVATAVFLGAVVPLVETKMAPTMTAMAATNKTLHGALSTPLSNPHPMKGKGKGNKGEDGGRCHGRQW